jgi:sugar (pentulose or hexulose) kinase
MDSITIWNYIRSQVEKIPETDLDVAATFYSGPFGSEGHISNMRESNMTVGHVFSAAFKSMAENYYQCSLRLSPEKEWDHIVFSGGLISKIPALQTAISKKLGADIFRINQSNEDVLMGLFIMAVKLHNMDMPFADAIHLARTTTVVSE